MLEKIRKQKQSHADLVPRLQKQLTRGQRERDDLQQQALKYVRTKSFNFPLLFVKGMSGVAKFFSLSFFLVR